MQLKFLSLLFLFTILNSYAGADEVASLIEKAPDLVPSGKVLKIVGSYSCIAMAGKERDRKIEQSCDDVVCYFSDKEKKLFWVTFNDMTSNSYDDLSQISTFTTSIYTDGIYALRITTQGKNSKQNVGAQVEISNLSESYDAFSPYAVGIGYTLEYLLSPTNRLLGAFLAADANTQVEVEDDGSETVLQLNTTFTAANGMSADIISSTVLSGASGFLLKSFNLDRIDRLKEKILLKKRERIYVSKWLNLSSEISFPEEASYEQTLGGKESTRYVFRCKSVEILEQFPDPPAIPPNSDVVDKRLGVSVRTGDAPSVISAEIRNYMEKK